jgi:hypothetical protein
MPGMRQYGVRRQIVISDEILRPAESIIAENFKNLIPAYFNMIPMAFVTGCYVQPWSTKT